MLILTALLPYSSDFPSGKRGLFEEGVMKEGKGALVSSSQHMISFYRLVFLLQGEGKQPVTFDGFDIDDFIRFWWYATKSRGNLQIMILISVLHHHEFYTMLLLIYQSPLRQLSFLLNFSSLRHILIMEIEVAFQHLRGTRWLIGQQLSGYQVPKTVLSSDCVSKGNSNPKDRESQSKGVKNCLGLAPKTSLWPQKYNNPSPAQYQQYSPKKQLIPSSFFRPPQKPKADSSIGKVGVGSYDLKVEKQSQCPFPREEKRGFIDQAQFTCDLIPGPGSYNPTNFQRHKSLTMLSKASKPNGYRIEGGKQKHSGVGPGSYKINGSRSMSCTVKYQHVHTDSNGYIQRVEPLKKVRRRNEGMVGPGSYLKIEQWCRYMNSKKASSNLTITSKGRTSSVYH